MLSPPKTTFVSYMFQNLFSKFTNFQKFINIYLI